MNKETWKDIPKFEGLYQASTYGRIRSVSHIRRNGTGKYMQKGKVLNFNINHSGYYQVRLSKNGKAKTYRVNRLIALTFIENTYNKETVNHIDGNKLNNRIENLEWATKKEQTWHLHNVLGVPYADCSKLALKRWKNEYLGA